ncbi:AAA family ATPase [Labrys okinawensis]|uniref:AAA family ATPase n=1 Tax=Labrys okinawensis TaxID=346911 RepID=UPI0039BC325B
MAFVVLTGASGSGKTTIARAIAARHGAAAKVFFFDSIGIPPVEEMVQQYGSGEAWQRAKTIDWMLRLAGEAKATPRLLFEGQTRFSFLEDGAAAVGGIAYAPILVDCDDDTRSKRLETERKQSELANKDMMMWARYLRNEALIHSYPILDTSTLSLRDSVEWVMERLEGWGPISRHQTPSQSVEKLRFSAAATT